MNKEELKKLQGNFSVEYAEIMNIYFQGYEWSKFHQSGSMYSFNPVLKDKFELYDINNIIITPYITNGRFKKFPNEYSMNREKFKQLYTECFISEDLKWNYHSFTLYSNGKYESSFIWNNEAYQAELKLNFFITLDWLYNRLQEYITSSDLMNPTFLLHPDGSISGDYSNIIESGYFIIERKNNFFYISGEAKSQKGEVFPFQYEPAGIRNQTYVPSAYVQEQLQNIYTLTLPNGGLSEVYPMWNKITIPIISSQLNFEDLETFKFEWREENA